MSSLESNGKYGNGGGSVGSVCIMVKLGASVVVDLAQVSESLIEKEQWAVILGHWLHQFPKYLRKWGQQLYLPRTMCTETLTTLRKK